MAQVHATWSPAQQRVLVWNEGGAQEAFTVAEIEGLCRLGNAVLVQSDDAEVCLALAPDDASLMAALRGLLPVDRSWLVAFLGAVRRALRARALGQATVAIACAGKMIGAAAARVVIDDAARGGSEPGSWAEALRWTGRGGLA